MTESAKEKSQRQALRETARERRLALVRRREDLFDMAASGFSVEIIAGRFGLTPGAVRRAMAQVVAARRLDAPEHFLHLQVARLHKALRAAEAAVDRDDLRGVAGMVKIIALLDRYHRPAAAEPVRAALSAQIRAPLALTHEPARDIDAAVQNVRDLAP